MPKWFGLILTGLIAASVAGCGGNEPAPTPTPLATVTPTVTLTPRPSATATATRTATHTATPPATSTATATLTETPTETSTETPTVAEMPTTTPIITATEAATQTAVLTETTSLTETTALTETVTVTQTVAVTETVSVTQTALLTTTEAGGGDGFTSPLAAPDSPLPVPPPATPDASPTAVPSPTPVVLTHVTGSWQLQAIRPSSSMTYTAAPPGYRVAFGPTGVVRVMADCKTGRGRYTSTDDGALSVAITFSDVRCAPESLADPFGQALSQVTAYRYNGDQLILLYGAQGGEMVLRRTPQMSPLGAPFLHWSTLQNSTFFVPSVPAGDNQAPMVDGEFRAPLAPSGTPVPEPAPASEPAGEFVISLSTMHTYGVLITPSPEEIAENPEITAEVSTDTIAVLVIVDGAAAPQSYLAPVLNGGGLPLSLQMELLGDNVLVRDLRWDGVQLRVDYEQDGKLLRHIYHFDDNQFVLDSEEELPPASPKARLDLPAQAVTLGPAEGAPAGVSQASLTGLIATGEIHPYRLVLAAGQPLSVSVQSAYDNVWLSIFGLQDGTVLRSIRSDATGWTGSAPSSQEYLISAVAPGSGSSYTLTIQAAEAAEPQTPSPAAPASAPTPAGKLIHLVIDGAALNDGGVAAPALLDLLRRSNAGVDFFVDAAQAGQTGSAAAAVAEAGHGLGVIAGSIRALTSDERDALFAEVSSARQALGGSAAACLRLPAAAGDAYTRAAAAELGFDVVQWDVDATGADVSALLDRLFPGAVVRLNAADGDSLAAGLETLLPALAQEGYSVQAMCR